MNRFHPVDYVVFVATLMIALGIGIFFSLTGGKQRSTKEYLTADRRLNIIPVALSLVATHVSAITVLGHPAEMYLFGSLYSLSWIAAAVGAAIAAFLWIPVFHPLGLTSVNEYLEMRYNSAAVKYLGCFYGVLGELIYTGICLYGPSLAIEIVTGFPVWAMILLSGGVATIYTTIGGMKAVIWTDVFQAIIMMVGVLAAVIKGCTLLGGGSAVWDLALKGGRIIFDDISVDPRHRMTIWGALIGTLIPWISIMGILQTSVQRSVSIGTLKSAQRSMFLTIVGILTIGMLSCFAGIVMFAYYYKKGCDPLGAKYISDGNQLMPYYVAEVLKVPGIPGLFIAAAFSASLSSASSAINGAAANIWIDIIRDKLPNIIEEKAAKITKLLGFISGIFAIGLGLLLIVIGGTIVQAVVSFAQAGLVPLGLMFGMGALVPWSNKWGALVGGVVGGVLPFWINMGSYTIKKHTQVLPTFLDGCPTSNASLFNNTTPASTLYIQPTTAATLNAAQDQPEGFLQNLYSLSHMWVNPFSLFLAFIIAVIVSFATGPTKAEDIDPVLLFPFVRKLLKKYNKNYDLSRFEKKHEFDKVPQEDHMNNVELKAV